jgi:hypothetical protein
MDNPLQRKTNSDLQCAEPTVKMCVADRCTCYVPENVPAVPYEHLASRCQLLITFQEQQPQAPEMWVSSGNCGLSADVALAVMLAAFIKGSFNTQIR